MASITFGARQTRDIIHLLIEVHGVLDHLYLDGTAPRITAPAEEYLRCTGSPHTLPGLIDAIDSLAVQLTYHVRHAVLDGPDRPRDDFEEACF